MKRWVVGLLVLLVPGLPGRADPALSLQEALRTAYLNNRQLKQSQLETARLERLRSAAGLQSLPTIQTRVVQSQVLTPMDYRIGRGVLGSYPGTGPIPSTPINLATIDGGQTTFQVVISQPLTDLHKVNLNVELKEQEIGAARCDEISAWAGLNTRVIQSYLSLLDTQLMLELMDDNLQFFREMERVTAEFLREKTALKADLLEVQAKRQEQEYQKLQLENALQTQKEMVNQLLGRAIHTPLRAEVPAALDSLSRPSDKNLRERALAQRPEILQAQHRLSQAEVGRELQRADFIPEVALQLSYEHTSPSGILPSQQALAQLSISWEPWDWGRRDHQIAARDLEVQKGHQALEDLKAQIASEVNSKERRCKELEFLRQARDTAVEAAEVRHRIVTLRYLHRTALTRDLLEAQVQLAQARRARQKLIFDEIIARAELDQAAGLVEAP